MNPKGAKRLKSASLSTIQRRVHPKICLTNADYTIPRGEHKLSNGIHVAVLDSKTFRAAALLIGNLMIFPDMPNGASIYDLFVSYLCPEDAKIMQELAEKVLQMVKEENDLAQEAAARG